MRVSLRFDIELNGTTLFIDADAEITREVKGGPITIGITRLKVQDFDGEINPETVTTEDRAAISARFKEIYIETYGDY